MLGPGSLERWTAPAGPWTEPDLHLFPQDGHRYEIIDGGLHVSPPAGGSHEATAEALVTTLRNAAPDGWRACTRMGIAIGSSSLVPDAAVLRPHASGGIWHDPADVALVVEVETEASRRLDRLLKPEIYADAGIEAYWRVERDPGPVLSIFGLCADGRYALHRKVQGRQLVAVDTPFPMRVAPSSWG
jgi:Uma2 family endonuclease